MFTVSSMTEYRPSVFVDGMAAPFRVCACPIRQVNSCPMIRIEMMRLFIWIGDLKLVSPAPEAEFRISFVPFRFTE